MIPKEDEEQTKFCDFLRLHNIKFKAIPNGMYLGKGANRFGYIAKMKRQGLETGYPDIDIYAKNKRHNLLIIEMKRSKKSLSKISPEQEDWINWLDKNDYCVAVAYGCDDAINIYNRYINNEY